MTSIVGIIRFSVLSDGVNHFAKRRDISFEQYAQATLSQKRLSERFYLFEAVTLPSLAAQHDSDFLIYVVAAERLQTPWRERLAGLALQYPFLRLVFAPEKDFTMKTVSGQILSEVDMSQPFVTFRLDDDDAVSMDFIQRLRRYNKARFAKMAVSLANGFILDFRGNDRFGLAPYLHSNCSAGIGVVGGPSFPKTIFDVTEKHFRMHKRLPTITDGREPAFVQTVHGSNDTGENRKLKGSADLSKREVEQQLLAHGFKISL